MIVNFHYEHIIDNAFFSVSEQFGVLYRPLGTIGFCPLELF